MEVDLFKGHPNPSLLPIAALTQASSSTFTTPALYTEALRYGNDEGHQPLRDHLSHWLTSVYQPRLPIRPQRLSITGGASQNLACILQVFTDPAVTRNVWMIAPTYFLAFRIFDDAGFAGRLRAVPQSEKTGVDLEFLRRGLVQAEADRAAAGDDGDDSFKPPRPWGKIYRHIIYATPTFSNPSTLTMSLSDREGLVRLARQFDALIVTDDVYDFLQWSGHPDSPLDHPERSRMPRVVDVDHYLDGGPKDDWGNAVSNGSFSKLLGPGVRTGWTEGTEKLAHGVSQAGSSRSGGCPSQLSAVIIDQLFPTGVFQRCLEESRLVYADRYYRLMKAIDEHLVPLGVRVSRPDVAGGYFVWLQLPSPLSAAHLSQRAQQHYGVKVATGNLFQIQGDADEQNDFDNAVRLSFSWEHEDRLAEGVRRLAQAIKESL